VTRNGSGFLLDSAVNAAVGFTKVCGWEPLDDAKKSKIMKTTLLAVLIGCALACSAQTNISPVYVTNYVAAAESFRRVEGKLYNVTNSVLWKHLEGECTHVAKNGVVVQQFDITVDRTYAPVNYKRDFFGHPSGPKRMVTGETTTKTPTKAVFLRNYTNMQAVANGSRIVARAMLVGAIDMEGERLECWDCGTRVLVPVVNRVITKADLANKKAAVDAAVLKWNQEQSEKGNDFGQYQMGIRYLKGDGVPKDLDKARDYLFKAAAQGNKDAAAELAKLSAPELPLQTDSPPKKGEDR
jgi:hypothetical protein